MELIVPENICQHTFLPQLNAHSSVFDFGANRGEFGHQIIHKFGSRVFAAEPVPALVSSMKPHPKLTLLPVAIAGESGSISINIFDQEWATVFQQSEFGKIAMAANKVETIDVPCVTLTEFKKRVGVQHIDLLKVDIEGSELSLFENTSDEELRDVDQMTVEFHDFLYKEMRPRVEAIKRRLAALGFWVLPFSRDNTDVLFINKKLQLSAAQLLWLGTAIKYSRGTKRILKRWFC